MALQDVASVYRWIVDDVISKARPEFVHEGVDEATLHELRELWEKKLFESGCLDTTPPVAAEGASEKPAVAEGGGGEGSKAEGEGGGLVGEKRAREGEGGEELPQKVATPQKGDGGGNSEAPQSEGGQSSGGKASKRSKLEGGEGDEDDDDLDIDSDDLDLGDTDDDDEFEDPSNLVVAQFEKVSRTKARWKCQLKAGIMHMNGRDYIFNRALGEFLF